MSQTKSNGNMVAIVTMFFLYAMVAFVTNMGAPFGNIWGFTYEWAGMMGNMMNFAAYLFMGVPAGNMLIKYGYKKTALIAMLVGALGLVFQYLSSIFGADIKTFTYDGQVIALNLLIYLLGAFICGFSVCMLNTVVCPMLNLLGGGGNRGNQLLQLGGSLNSLTATLTPFLTGVLIGTVTEKTAMSDVSPLLFIGIGVFVLSFFIVSRIKITEPQQINNEEKFEHSPWNFRHCVLGIIAIFFYVGVEIGIPAELNFYISGMPFEGAAAVGGTLAAVYWLCMLIGRASSSALSGKISTKVQMVVSSSIAIAFLLIAILLPESVSMNIGPIEIFGNKIIPVECTIPIKCIFIFLCGLCTSIMWGGIFNLATEGLGKYTAKASGLFMMMVVGGGIMPLIQDQIALKTDYISSYWLVIAMLAYILYFSLIGCKNVNKNIPV